MEFYGFGGPEVTEGLGSHREKRQPDFSGLAIDEYFTPEA